MVMSEANDLLEAIISALGRVRATSPLVQNITNYVVMNNTANALLAIGASPAMVHAPEEAGEFIAISGALVVNPGTLSKEFVAGMHVACEQARALGRPWVLDPVGVGATAYRNQTNADLLRHLPAVVRCNASELLALASVAKTPTKGVDSTHGADEAVLPAIRFARGQGCVASVSGEVDVVTDGVRLVRIANGHALMPRVTGLGCTASALTGAFLAVEKDALVAASAALVVLGLAGELAAARSAGPGSLQMHLLDLLYTLDANAIRAGAKLTVSKV
jgi:hydroxyethylthiazole kinase